MRDSADADPVFGEYIPPFPPSSFKFTRWMRFKEFWSDHIAEPLAWLGLAICISTFLYPKAPVLLIKLLLGIG